MTPTATVTFDDGPPPCEECGAPASYVQRMTTLALTAFDPTNLGKSIGIYKRRPLCRKCARNLKLRNASAQISPLDAS
jgi:hypothetical protein